MQIINVTKLIVPLHLISQFQNSTYPCLLQVRGTRKKWFKKSSWSMGLEVVRLFAWWSDDAASSDGSCKVLHMFQPFAWLPRCLRPRSCISRHTPLHPAEWQFWNVQNAKCAKIFHQRERARGVHRNSRKTNKENKHFSLGVISLLKHLLIGKQKGRRKGCKVGGIKTRSQAEKFWEHGI